MRRDTPNDLQMVPLCNVHPSPENVRLFIERMSLADLEAVYHAYRQDETRVLPDAPILRYRSANYLEILAGERRITAARNAGLDWLPCRIVDMTDEDAYAFILAHNDVAGLTTVELAFRAVEMERLGFPEEEIKAALKGASPYRYLLVGSLLDPAWFTDTKKLCDPSIVEWYEAAVYGEEHFRRCFEHWDAGLWDAETCGREFRKRGKMLPHDTAERGIRLTLDHDRLVIRGQIDASFLTGKEAVAILRELRARLGDAERAFAKSGHFGSRTVIRLNPETVWSL